jgi:hypothetical protein
MSYTGRCACGNVTLAISGEAIAIRQCWCRQCQQIAAGGPTHNAMFRTDDVAIEGALSTHSYVAASGNTITQAFCTACGSPIMGYSSARPQFRTIRLGAIDTPHDLKPQMAIWLEDAPDWAAIDPAIEQHRRQPPAPVAR